jgi:hypothetical protein
MKPLDDRLAFLRAGIEPIAIVHEPPIASRPSYTTRPEWSSPGESLWMRIAKFSYCNHLTLTDLLYVLNPEASSHNFDLRRQDGLNWASLSLALGTPENQLRQGLCPRPPSGYTHEI